MACKTDFPKSSAVWLIGLIAWVGLGAAFTTALGDALVGNELGLRIGVVAMFWALYATGIAAYLVPRPWGLVVTRLGSAYLIATGIVVGVITTPSLSMRVLPGIVAGLAFATAMSPQVGDRFVDGASYPGERRFAFRWPREAVGGIAIATVLPAVTIASIVTALAVGGLGRWLFVAIALVTAPPAGLVIRQLELLGRRWLVFAPRALVVHDPFTLEDAMSIPLPRVLDMSAAPGDLAADGLLDVRGGYSGRWIQTVFDAAQDTPRARALPAALAQTRPKIPATVTGIAWPVTSIDLCIQTAREIGLPVDGNAIDVDDALVEFGADHTAMVDLDLSQVERDA